MTATRRLAMVVVLLAALLLPRDAVAEGQGGAGTDTPLEVVAAVTDLPVVKRCLGQERRRVVTRYRVERVLSGTHDAATLLVVHTCPEVPRGPSDIGRGDARAIRPGSRHRLTLRPVTGKLPALTDPFEDDPAPRYRAVRTDPAPPLPRVVVVVEGGAGTSHKLDFERDTVVVGSGPDADVHLDEITVAERHLQLTRVGTRVHVMALQPTLAAAVNGAPLAGPRPLTFEDRITLGSYTLRVALFVD